jgi:Ca-activated chloride channel family protein
MGARSPTSSPARTWSDVNTHLLDRLAADNGGTVTYVQPGENLEAILTDFYAHIAHPALTDVEIQFEGLEVSELYPKALPDMFYGSSLLLTGRYRATADTVAVRVRGRAGDREKEYIYHFDLDQAGGHDFVPRLWATRRVGDLLDRVRVEGETLALVEEIQGLGLAYGLVTPYTTFAIQAQTHGAASLDNMGLYAYENQGDLNRASGQITTQARAQNLAYQDATQASLAIGANILNNGQHSLAQTHDLPQRGPKQALLNVDLSLLQGQGNLDDPINVKWIMDNVGIDRAVAFGSEEYFALAADPANRPFLQSGTNVVFSQGGKVILVQETEMVESNPTAAQTTGTRSSEGAVDHPSARQTSANWPPKQQRNTAAKADDRLWSLAPFLLLIVVGALAAVSIFLNVWQMLCHRKSTRR